MDTWLFLTDFELSSYGYRYWELKIFRIKKGGREEPKVLEPLTHWIKKLIRTTLKNKCVGFLGVAFLAVTLTKIKYFELSCAQIVPVIQNNTFWMFEKVLNFLNDMFSKQRIGRSEFIELPSRMPQTI